MASVRLLLVACMTFFVFVGGRANPEHAQRRSVIAAGLAMDGDECEVDATGSGGLCYSSLSFRQLRSERQAEAIQASKVVAGERRAEAIHKASEAAGRQRGNGNGNEESVDSECEADKAYCFDITTYLLQEDCSADSQCRVLDMSDYFHEVPKGVKWLCAPADRTCDEHVDLSHAMFQSVDEVPEQYEDRGRNVSIGGTRTDSTNGWACRYLGMCAPEVPSPVPEVPSARQGAACTKSRCGFYDSSAPCQCNEHCSEFGNCCANYKGFCASGGADYGSTCEGRTCFTYVKHAMCQCNTKCTQYGNCCHDYNKVCNPSDTPSGDTWSSPGIGVSRQTMTLYHTTSLKAAKLIVRGGFRPGKSGWCGGAIYFVNTPHLKRSKFGPKTHIGAILEAKVEMGRMATHFNRRCKGYGEIHGHGVSAAKRAGYNSIRFNPGDGNEFIIWSPKQVLSVRIYRQTR